MSNMLNLFWRKKERELPKLGLALGSGSARGIAHVGVLKALIENEIRVDYIAGTSAGAIVALLYAAGFNVDRLLVAVEQLSFSKLTKLTLSKQGLSSSASIEKLVLDLTGDITFEELKIPCKVITTDLVTGDAIVIDSGPIAFAARASAGFVGVFSPIESEDGLLVDGGVSMPIPVAPLEQMGADVIVAVDVNPYIDKEDRPTNIISIISRTIDVLIKKASEAALERADIVIEPICHGCSSLAIKDAKVLIKMGEAATLQAIPAIREKLAAS